MSSQRPLANQFEDTIWNWYTDSNSKANSPLHVVSNDNSSSPRLPHCLSVLQPLGIKLKNEPSISSGHTATLKSYSVRLQYIRLGDIDKYCRDWYGMQTTTAQKAGIEHLCHTLLVGSIHTEAFRNAEGLSTKEQSQLIFRIIIFLRC